MNFRRLKLSVELLAAIASVVFIIFNLDRVWFWRPEDLLPTFEFALLIGGLCAIALWCRVQLLLAVVGPAIFYWLATGLYVEGLSALYLCSIGYSVGRIVLKQIQPRPPGFSLTALIGFATLTILLPPLLTFVPHFMFFKGLLWLLPVFYGRDLWLKLAPVLKRETRPSRGEIASFSAVAIGLGYAATFCNIPDITFDSLLMHLNIPYRLNILGGTFFDPAQVYWAFYPQGVDHLFALATWGLDLNTPKMVNFLALLLAADVARLSWGEVRFRPSYVAFCLACPILLQQVAQSFIDLVWSVYLVLACLIFRQGDLSKIPFDPSARTFVVTLFLLAGCAAKLFTACYLIPFLPFLLPALWRLKPLEKLSVWTFGVLALWWGWYGYYRTGNPIFPLYNNLWHSPYFSTERFGDLRWFRTLSWRSLWDLTVHANYFGEIDPGALGLTFVFVLPVALLAVFTKQNNTAKKFVLIILLGGGLLVMCLQPYYRYLLPTVLGLHLLAASKLSEHSQSWTMQWIAPTLTWLAAIALIGSQGWFARRPLMHSSVRGRHFYIAENLPHLALFHAIDEAPEINRIMVVPPSFSRLLGLKKPAYLNNVYSQLVARRYSALRTDAELSDFMKDLDILEFMVEHDREPKLLTHFGCRRRFENLAFDLISCR